MAGTITVDTIQSDSSYNSVLNIPSKVNFTGGMQIGGQDTTFAGMRNRLINGDMRIDQRNMGNSISTFGLCLDRWSTSKLGNATYTTQQVTDAPTGFSNSLKLTVTGAQAPATGDTYQLYQTIEGTSIVDLCQGTNSATPITLSFWVKSSITGQYGVSLASSNLGAWIVNTYTVNQANTWEYKTITFVGSTSGTWVKDTTAGLYLVFDLGSGSNQTTATTGSWLNDPAGKRRTAACVNWTATNNATWQVTGVQIEKGSSATPFEYRHIQQELALCQRYYYKLTATSAYNFLAPLSYNVSGTVSRSTIMFPVSLRVAPTSVEYANVGLDDGGAVTNTTSITLFGAASTTQIGLNYNVASGLTTYRPMMVTATSSGNGYLAFPAEF